MTIGEVASSSLPEATTARVRPDEAMTGVARRCLQNPIAFESGPTCHQALDEWE